MRGAQSLKLVLAISGFIRLYYLYLMIAHLDLDAFFASVEQRDHPQLVGKPVIVGFVTPQGTVCNRGVVSAASYEIRKYGVCSGMSLWEAKKRCPSAIIISGNFAKYDEASQKMYQIIGDYTPKIEPLGLDEAFLDFGGCEDLYHHDLVAVCWEIKKRIKKEIGITGSVGLASNKIVAKVASDFQKPDGLTVVPKGDEAEFLAPLVVERLYGVGPKICQPLYQIGIKTIGDLASIPPEILKSWFGVYGVILWQWANGIDSRQVLPLPPPKSVGRSITFPKNSRNRNYLLANLRYLAEKVAAQMRQEGVVGYCITVSIRQDDFQTYSHQKTFIAPLSSAQEIFEAGKHLLNEAWDQKTVLRLIGINVSHFDLRPEQLTIFGSSSKRRLIEEKMDKIREKFGFWSIRPASLPTNLNPAKTQA